MEYRVVPDRARDNGQPQPEPASETVSPQPQPQTEGNWLPPGEEACTIATTRYALRPLYDGFVHRRIARRDSRSKRKEKRRQDYIASQQWLRDPAVQATSGMLEFQDAELPSTNMDLDGDDGLTLDDLDPSRQTYPLHNPEIRARGQAASREAARRKRLVLEMALQGKTMADIGRALGMSSATVKGILEKELTEGRDRQSVSKLRRLTMARLERLNVALWPAAVGWVEAAKDGERKVHLPDLNAVDRVLKIQERICAIGGLNVTTSNVNLGLQDQRRATRLNPDVAYEMMKAGVAAAARLNGDGPPELEYDPGPSEMALE